MKIAVASESGADGGGIGHFGRCMEFVVFEVRGEKILGREVVKNPFYDNHVPGEVPKFLISQNVDILITRAAGQNAIKMLESASIRVVFAQGEVRDAVDRYLEGKLPEASNVCSH